MFTPKNVIRAYFQTGAVRSPVMTLEVAQTDAELARGLMNRVQMPPHYGMLFVYKEPKQHSFWMKNTYIPLDIAWLNDEGHVLEQHVMQPHDETQHKPLQPAKFAIELRAGTLNSYGVRLGDRLVRLKG